MRARPRHGLFPRVPRAPRALLVLGLLVTLAAAACDGGGGGGGGGVTNGLERLPAGEVGTRTLTALRTAPGVHLVGAVSDPRSDAPAQFDLVMSPTTTRGTVEEYDQETQLVKIKGDTYVRRARGYYTATGDDAAASLLADRWVRLAATDAAKYSYFTLERYSDSLRGYLAGLAGGVRQDTVDGARVVRATASDGTTFDVANTGPAYPVRITLAGASTTRLTFTEFRAPAAATPPSSPVDLSTIG
ncbi:hypothetical protein [Frankia sp. AgKG'84/4]|uniref:hypothetical protein n=1 Tax=Frankia sp. AgKG'84/4 TaxID=573490 RepID=UPI00202A40AA|nr:hypothetical protein [Frankia sp. AgKG'84/4]MCL9795294.1 hypothetical protein [Frankia sp. AgKG'84/4]